MPPWSKEGDSYYVDLGGDKLLIDPAKVNDKLDAYVGKAIKAGIRPEDIKDDEEFLAKHPTTQHYRARGCVRADGL